MSIISLSGKAWDHWIYSERILSPPDLRKLGIIIKRRVGLDCGEFFLDLAIINRKGGWLFHFYNLIEEIKG